MKAIFISFLFTLSPCVSAKLHKILILGDSLTEGYGLSKKDAYPRLMEQALQKEYPHIKVINAGSSGSTTASGPSRLKWHRKSKPQIVVLALGANDGLRGIKTDASKKNLEQTILMAKEIPAKVILVGMKMPYNYGQEYRKKFEKMFDQLAKKYQLTYMPFMLKGVAQNPKYNLSDGIHPNEEGHKIMAKNLLPYIIKVLKEVFHD